MDISKWCRPRERKVRWERCRSLSVKSVDLGPKGRHSSATDPNYFSDSCMSIEVQWNAETFKLRYKIKKHLQGCRLSRIAWIYYTHSLMVAERERGRAERDTILSDNNVDIICIQEIGRSYDIFPQE